MTLAAEIRAEAARQRVSITSLAHATGMTRTTLSRKLGGHRPLTLEDAQALADALHTPLSEIARRAESTAA